MPTPDAATIDTVHSTEFTHADIVEKYVFGFWMYVMSDLILFSTLFATFAVIGHNYAGGSTGKELFDLRYTFGETMFLLFSSTVYGLAMLAMHKGRRALLQIGLAVTFLLGAGFIVMEINEFLQMIIAGNGPERSGFLSAFFTLVGTHGTHVTFGLIWMGLMAIQVLRKGLTTPVRSRLMRLSLFWHFLDIVWIGIFTFVYLMGVM
jgi:cytochrome o ubiquinol oxidase subunit 3